MSLTMKDYSKRLIDDKLDKYLNIFGAVSIEGPKWCGKTWTSLNHASSVTYMTEEDKRNLALVNPKYIFTNERPQLIDEWQLSPNIWDAVRHECDSDKKQIFNFGKHYEDIDYDYLKQLCNGVFVKTDKTLYNAEKSMEDHGVTFTLDIKKLYDEHKSDASNNKKKIR